LILAYSALCIPESVCQCPTGSVTQWIGSVVGTMVRLLLRSTRHEYNSAAYLWTHQSPTCRVRAVWYHRYTIGLFGGQCHGSGINTALSSRYKLCSLLCLRQLSRCGRTLCSRGYLVASANPRWKYCTVNRPESRLLSSMQNVLL
jgi:hypothetical protein